jgi:hypothetical protein
MTWQVVAEEVHHPKHDIGTLVVLLLICTLVSVLRGPNR